VYDVSNTCSFPSRVKTKRTKGGEVDELSAVKRVNDDFTLMRSVRPR